jgi:hypothetical protein
MLAAVALQAMLVLHLVNLQLTLTAVPAAFGFIDHVDRQESPAILLYDPAGWDSQGERWTHEMRAMIAMQYEPVERLAETIVLRPRRP